MKITIAEINAHRDRWIDTSLARADGKIEYREKKAFGNRHAVFENGARMGDVHIDSYNATDVPEGTIKHISNYAEEKTGIPQWLFNLLIVGGILYGGYRIAKWGSSRYL